MANLRSAAISALAGIAIAADPTRFQIFGGRRFARRGLRIDGSGRLALDSRDLDIIAIIRYTLCGRFNQLAA